MENREAIEMLERFQNPEPWEPKITDRAYEALQKAISALENQEQDRWIPVTEKLPEYGQVAMWCNENGSVFSSAITYKHGDDWAIGKRHRYKSVLAWKPLPEPYTEEEA